MSASYGPRQWTHCDSNNMSNVQATEFLFIYFKHCLIENIQTSDQLQVESKRSLEEGTIFNFLN